MDVLVQPNKLIGSEFILFDSDSSAFTLPNSKNTQLICAEYSSNSLPTNSILSRALVQNANSTLDSKHKKTFGSFRKTSSSVSLNEVDKEQLDDIWVGSIALRRTAKPNLENEYHRENSLRLSVLEARNIPDKRRYYCDISLDRRLYARTTSKTATTGIFWAEDFDLNNLPDISIITLSLYRDATSSGKEGRRIVTSRLGSKRFRKSCNQLVGYVTIPLSELSGRTEIQTWLTLQPPIETLSQDDLRTDLNESGTSLSKLNRLGRPVLQTCTSNSSGSSIKTSNGDYHVCPQLRIRARYRSIAVLPLSSYLSLRSIALDKGILLTTWLENLLPVKGKEELANSLICLHEHNGTLVEFLTEIVLKEIKNLESDSMAFRSNTIATKAVECYVKLIGASYLHDLLRRIVQDVLTHSNAWEVDPDKLPPLSLTGYSSLTAADTVAFANRTLNLELYDQVAPGSLIFNQLMLLRYFDFVWHTVQSSFSQFPRPLVQLFASFRSSVEPSRGAEFCDNLISSCIFLRLICPALLSPSLFGLVSAFPSQPGCQRNLTLLAKSLQSLANFTTFDDKESYMRFLNGYVQSQLPSMRNFIRSISSNLNSLSASTDSCREVIDQGYELASLHLILSDIIYPPSSNHSESSVTKELCLSTEINPEVLKNLPTDLHSLPTTVSDISCEILKFSGHCNPDKDLGSLITKDQTLEPLKSQLSTRKTSKTKSTSPYLQSTHQPPIPNHSVPYYTLHNNPGFYNPITGNSNGRPTLDVLTPKLTQSISLTGLQSLESPFQIHAHSNVNDYDEPYTGPDSETDIDPISCKNGTCRTDNKKLNEPSCSVHDEQERIYDTVPSGSSSIDELVKANVDDNGLDDVNHNKNHSGLPASSLHTTNGYTQPILTSMVDVPNRTLDKYLQPMPKTHDSPISQLNHSKHIEMVKNIEQQVSPSKRLSPQVVQRQVARANVILARPNSLSPTKPTISVSSCLVSPSSPNADQKQHNFTYITQMKMQSPILPNMRTSVDHTLAYSNPLPHHIHATSERSLDTYGRYKLGNSDDYQTDSSVLSKSLAQSIDSHGDDPSTNLNWEIERLREELKISQQDAIRTADRLSKQETEIFQLRKMLGNLKVSAPDPTISESNSLQTRTKLQSDTSRSPSYRFSPYQTELHGIKNGSSTLEELDDAMARLEHEQEELVREQARIRARLVASRHLDRSLDTTTATTTRNNFSTQPITHRKDEFVIESQSNHSKKNSHPYEIRTSSISQSHNSKVRPNLPTLSQSRLNVHRRLDY